MLNAVPREGLRGKTEDAFGLVRNYWAWLLLQAFLFYLGQYTEMLKWWLVKKYWAWPVSILVIRFGSATHSLERCTKGGRTPCVVKLEMLCQWWRTLGLDCCAKCFPSALAINWLDKLNVIQTVEGCTGGGTSWEDRLLWTTPCLRSYWSSGWQVPWISVSSTEHGLHNSWNADGTLRKYRGWFRNHSLE